MPPGLMAQGFRHVDIREGDDTVNPKMRHRRHAVVYSGERLRAVSFPLGGIGTGQVAICGDGGLRQWQFFNNINHRAHVPSVSSRKARGRSRGFFSRMPDMMTTSNRRRRCPIMLCRTPRGVCLRNCPAPKASALWGSIRQSRFTILFPNSRFRFRSGPSLHLFRSIPKTQGFPRRSFTSISPILQKRRSRYQFS